MIAVTHNSRYETLSADTSATSLEKTPTSAPDSHVMLHMPVDVRSASLGFIALGVGIALLRWTQEFIVPVLLGVVLSYALTPLVDRLERLRVPRMAGAGLALTLILASFGAGGYALRGEAEAFVSTLPAVAQQLRRAWAPAAGEGEGTLAKVQQAGHRARVGRKSRRPSDRCVGRFQRGQRDRSRPPGFGCCEAGLDVGGDARRRRETRHQRA